MQIVKKTTQRCKLQQLKAKILLEEISEHILKQDAWYRHYGNNLEQIVVKEETLARQNFDKTGSMVYHQILLPQHLLLEYFNAFTVQPTNTLAPQKCCRKSDKII